MFDKENTQYSEGMLKIKEEYEFKEWLISIGYFVYRFHLAFDGTATRTRFEGRLLDIPFEEYLETVPETDWKARIEYYVETRIAGYSLRDCEKTIFY
jgi:hypothetical protein